MLHPSYSELINVANADVDPGEAPVVQSRYSIVIASAKRARQIIDGDAPLVKAEEGRKPLSVAIEEISKNLVNVEKGLDYEEEPIQHSHETEDFSRYALDEDLEEEDEEEDSEEEEKEYIDEEGEEEDDYSDGDYSSDGEE